MGILRTSLAGATRLLGSFGLACTLLVFLMVLTLLGTLAQAEQSLYEVQQTYFTSGFFIERIAGVPIVLPGGYLLLSVLFVNLLVGGLLRMRKGRSTAGVLVIHVGILVLLVGAFVEERFAVRGSFRLHEGESAAAFDREAAWEVVVTERLPGGGARDHVLPPEAFARFTALGRLRLTSAALPFDVGLHGFLPRAQPLLAGGGEELEPAAAEGFVLAPLPEGVAKDVQAPGFYASVWPKGGGEEQRGILWALQQGPFVCTVAGRTFELDFRRQALDLPFTLVLERFVFEKHPGTSTPSRFSSYLRQVDGGATRDVHITMNEPLRQDGYTIYQSSWGPQDAPPGTPLFSVFAVARNPSDRLPIVACTLVALGLLLHWVRKLVLHVRGSAPSPSPGVPS